MLVHSTQEDKLVDILVNRKSINIPKDTGIMNNPEISDYKLIYLSYVHFFGDINGWGDYHFYLNLEWVKDNRDQFASNAYDGSIFFKRFLNEYSITKTKILGKDSTFNQVVSTKAIPFEGIESLLIDNCRDDSGMDFIHDDGTAYSIKDVLPENIKLYYRKKHNLDILRIS